MPTTKQDFIDALTHIQTICKIYDMSSMKVERIEIYTKQLLDKLKKEVKVKKGGKSKC